MEVKTEFGSLKHCEKGDVSAISECQARAKHQVARRVLMAHGKWRCVVEPALGIGSPLNLSGRVIGLSCAPVVPPGAAVLLGL